MRWIVLACALAGCFQQATIGMTAAGARGGGAIEAATGTMALRTTGELALQQLGRDDGSTTVGAIYGNALRGSLPGALFPDRDAARWIDFGADIGYGVGLHGSHGFARAYAGGWLDVRFLPYRWSYPTLRVQLRRVAYTAGLADDTELFVGLGWTVLPRADLQRRLEERARKRRCDCTTER